MIATAPKKPSFFRRLENAALLLIAPRGAATPDSFCNACSDGEFHTTMMDEIQCLRGRVYLEDGAISASRLDEQGRFRSALDAGSWHLALLDEHMNVAGCMRITRHARPSTCRVLTVHELIERMGTPDAIAYEQALQSFFDQTVQEGLTFYEIGGWAVAPQYRNSSKAIVLAAACWSLAQLLAPGRGVASATLRNQSAPILRRLGGFSLHHRLTRLTKFFDPVYRCDMELLAFDSELPAPELRWTVADIRAYLKTALVVTNPAGTPAGWASPWRGVKVGVPC